MGPDYPYAPLHWGPFSFSHRKEDIHDGECTGLGRLGWGWPLLSTLIPRWAQQKKPKMASAPSLLFRAAWAGRQMPLRSCADFVFPPPWRRCGQWSPVHVELLFWPKARAFCWSCKQAQGRSDLSTVSCLLRTQCGFIAASLQIYLEWVIPGSVHGFMYLKWPVACVQRRWATRTDEVKPRLPIHYKTLACAHGGGFSWAGKEMRNNIFKSLSEGGNQWRGNREKITIKIEWSLGVPALIYPLFSCLGRHRRLKGSQDHQGFGMACPRASSPDSGEAGDNHIPHISSSPEGGRPGSRGLSLVLSGLPGWLTRGQSWEVVLAVHQALWSCWRSWSLRRRSSPHARLTGTREGTLLSHHCWHAWPLFLRSSLKLLVAVDLAGRKLWGVSACWQESSTPHVRSSAAEPEFLSGSDEQVGLQQKRHRDLARWSV